MLKIRSAKPEETLQLGEKLGKLLLPGDFVSLNGDLGAGKTLLVKGMGLGLGISPQSITSPTFTIINEYEGVYPLYHFDLYRLEKDLDLEQVGYLDYFYGNGITAAEWGGLFRAHLPEDRMEIELKRTGCKWREITFVSLGSRSLEILAQLRGLV